MVQTPAHSEPPTEAVVSKGEAKKGSMETSREMQIVVAATPFKLPSDWIVEVRPRPRARGRSKHSDKYYYEPGTGRQFRSLPSVKRYLTGEDEFPPRKGQSNCLVPYHSRPPTFKRVIYGGKVLTLDEFEDIDPETLQFEAASTLPDGWIVEEVPRRCGSRSDRYYIDPATGRRFRSILEVHRFLEAQIYKPQNKALTLSVCSTTPRSPSPGKKNTSVKKLKDSTLDLMNPPEKINWVYSGDGQDTWSPLVEESVLPIYVKEQWSEAFLLRMNGWEHRVPQLTMH